MFAGFRKVVGSPPLRSGLAEYRRLKLGTGPEACERRGLGAADVERRFRGPSRLVSTLFRRDRNRFTRGRCEAASSRDVPLEAAELVREDLVRRR